MPGDTKIKPAPNAQSGWIDVDNPSFIYGSRRLARDARRARLSGTAPAYNVTLPNSVTSVPRQTSGPTGLRARLFDRLTTQQGASESEASYVLANFGYNASASYGHMRAAGATHTEAVLVISLGSPAASLTYGQARAAGVDHNDAFVGISHAYQD